MHSWGVQGGGGGGDLRRRRLLLNQQLVSVKSIAIHNKNKIVLMILVKFKNQSVLLTLQKGTPCH